MTSSLDELLNAEFKEAFDEFDKVNKFTRFSSLANESLVEKRSQPFPRRSHLTASLKLGRWRFYPFSLSVSFCTSEFQSTILLNYEF